MLKQKISGVLRKLGLALLADKGRYYFMSLKNVAKNNNFKKEFPDAVLPPPYLIYESFQMDLRKYYLGGKEDAAWVIDLVRPYVAPEDGNIMDWGCGPARILRHMPELIKTNATFYGVDYNSKTIQWCKKNLPGILFVQNKVNPPLPFEEDFFKLIYGISVFTHLSAENQQAWSKELHRIISPSGVVMLTTSGDAFMEKLTDAEIALYKQGELITRGNVVEGHRMYSAFHPSQKIRKIFEDSGFEVLKHLPGKKVNEAYISQDVWLLRKIVKENLISA